VSKITGSRLDLLGSRNVIDHVTIRLAVVDFLWVVHSDHTSVLHRYGDLCKKNCSVYIQHKGDIVVVDIKQLKSQFNNSNFTITQSAKFF